jgi:hypothetical protein
VNVYFLCPNCERPGVATAPASTPWRCPSCDHLLSLTDPAAKVSDEGVKLQACAACGNHELYKMKGFPHWLGMSILLAAVMGFILLNAVRLQWWAWGILIGSAIIDGGLFLLVKDVAVCYRCGAHHRGIGKSGNEPFDLAIHERYRQERIRLGKES